jgi:hypothetical protein
MKAKQTKSKKKPMTLDDFAVLIQKDLARMAMKDDLRGLATTEDLQVFRAETRKEFAAIREQMATKEDLAAESDRISVAKDQLQEQISGLKYAKEIDELRARVNVLESKLGIKPARRAA